MRIAVQAADLDAERIDGTRVYILRLLDRFGRMFPSEEWKIFHRGDFNPDLTPPNFRNYRLIKAPFPISWTQTRFSWELFRYRPERLFMPVQALPVLFPKDTESIVTIHDLAFKLFPEYFPTRDLRKLNWLTDLAIRRSTRIIAVSESTKRDILKWYPKISEKKIRVIHHGFDAPSMGSSSGDGEYDQLTLQRLGISREEYVLYVGALQPRKNLIRLMAAFESFGRRFPSAKLVLAGESAWMSDSIFRARESNAFRERIVMTGRISFEERSALYRNARMFAYPSLYEGFGLPVLEAFSFGIPVVCADNSSLSEIAGDAAKFFEAPRADHLAETLIRLWDNSTDRSDLRLKGYARLREFSWDKCALETANWIIGRES